MVHAHDSYWSFCSNIFLRAIARECYSEKYNWWFWNFLYDWQALAAGSIALLGAAGLAIQIWMQGRELRRQRRKEEIQARLLLPHSLSNVHRYLEQVGRAWLAMDMSRRPKAISDQDLQAITAAATVADKKTFETVKHLVQALQTFESRLDDPSPTNYYDIIIRDMAQLWVLTNSLYAYGRFVSSSAPYRQHTKRDLISALDHPLGLWKLPPHDPIRERVESGLKFIR